MWSIFLPMWNIFDSKLDCRIEVITNHIAFTKYIAHTSILIFIPFPVDSLTRVGVFFPLICEDWGKILCGGAPSHIRVPYPLFFDLFKAQTLSMRTLQA